MKFLSLAGLGLGIILLSCFNLRIIHGQGQGAATRPPAFNGFGGQEGSTDVKLNTNETKVKDSVRPRICYQCVDLKVKSTLLTAVPQRCQLLRSLLRMKRQKPFFDLESNIMVTAALSKLVKEKVDLNLTDFHVQCPFGVEDCFALKPVDHRLLGFEQRGCGSGPKEVAAEPGEKCVEDYQKIEQNDTLMRNCVCDDEDACNENGGTGLYLSGWLIAVTLSFVVLRRFP